MILLAGFYDFWFIAGFGLLPFYLEEPGSSDKGRCYEVMLKALNLCGQSVDCCPFLLY